MADTVALPELPKKYKAAVYDKPGEISTKVVELDMPEPGPGEVLINLTHSGVCHSDFGIMTNSWKSLPSPTPAGQVGGHEGVGRIVRIGPGAANSGIRIGDRVGVKWVLGICFNCVACLDGHESACLQKRISGYLNPGTFQQYIVSPLNYVTPIPDGLDSAEAAPMLCAGVTVYSALRKCGAQSGQTVVLLGAGGGLGHIACQIAAKGMAMRVIGIDADNKRDLVLASGAEHFIGLSEKPTHEKVLALTGGLGAQAAIVLTAANAAYADAMFMIRFGGRVVCVGMPEGKPRGIATAFPALLVSKAQSILGVMVGNRQEAIETLELARKGLVKTHYRTEKMENLTKVFQEMHATTLQGRVVLDLTA